MKCQLLLLLGVFFKLSHSDSEPQTTLVEGYLLCKSCGEDSTVLNLIDNTRLSNHNLGFANITFGEKEVVVQDLTNPRGITFRILISKKAKCAQTSTWYKDSTWFEGYAWKICQCPSCRAHIGWMFEPFESAAKNPIYPSDKGFYAIILDSVISEAYVNSLLIVDKILRN
ncbi:CLUMA_CG003799, isoform A [Clunio marinus]|uniref:CLUMA_CG003799, isoform A n=1 Tax=Clunio marinus TaxID=568069 RepID=A0A1J1HV97_9DIPT|nr:CLUMA_CG003799, isoform A [Clunio marinus]